MTGGLPQTASGASERSPNLLERVDRVERRQDDYETAVNSLMDWVANNLGALATTLGIELTDMPPPPRPVVR